MRRDRPGLDSSSRARSSFPRPGATLSVWVNMSRCQNGDLQCCHLEASEGTSLESHRLSMFSPKNGQDALRALNSGSIQSLIMCQAQCKNLILYQCFISSEDGQAPGPGNPSRVVNLNLDRATCNLQRAAGKAANSRPGPFAGRRK